MSGAQIIRHPLRKEDMTAIAAIHLVGPVNPGRRSIGSFVYIRHAINWSAMNLMRMNARLCPQCRGNLGRAIDRRFWITEKYQRHPIASRQSNQVLLCVRRAKLSGVAQISLCAQ